MTKQEAIRWLQLDIEMMKFDPTTGEEAYLNEDAKKTLEALDMAIAALSNEQKSDDSLLKSDPNSASKGDVIYRQDVIDMIEMYPFTEYGEYEEAREVISRLPSAQPEQRWIPVSERLPEEDDMYLVTVHPRYIVPGGIQIDMLGRHEGKWYFQDLDGRDAVFPDPVIAWLPLPEPHQAEMKGEKQ